MFVLGMLLLCKSKFSWEAVSKIKLMLGMGHGCSQFSLPISEAHTVPWFTMSWGTEAHRTIVRALLKDNSSSVYLWCNKQTYEHLKYKMEQKNRNQMQHKNIRSTLMLDQTKGPPSPALCSHSGQPAIGQEPTRQDMVQQHPPTHVPQQLVHTGLLLRILEIAHNHQGHW